MILTDTILALSSPPAGSGLRAILRLSGPDAHRLAFELVEIDPATTCRYAPNLNLRHWPPNNRLASLLLFHAPRSFTGQDIAELHLPNSPGITRWTLDHLLATARTRQLPARMAYPGEFSARAFFNAKMDLTEAEGIAATINAQNESQLRAAASLRQGDLHRWLAATADRIANLLALVEAGIDFVDEEGIRFVVPSELSSKLIQLGEHVQETLALAIRIDRLLDLPTVVFIGKPNVGKSSLINALASQDRSMVSPVAGTTRDMLSVIMKTSQGDVRLVDVPGEEERSDELRSKMMDARESALLDADLILEIVANSSPVSTTVAECGAYAASCFTVQNKCDLLSPEDLRACEFDENGARFEGHGDWQLVSAKTGLHIQKLREFIGTFVSRGESMASDRMVLNHRHRAILQEVHGVLDHAGYLAAWEFEKHPELLAAEMRRALDLLGQITGTISPDEVLGRIFSTFCIGK